MEMTWEQAGALKAEIETALGEQYRVTLSQNIENVSPTGEITRKETWYCAVWHGNFILFTVAEHAKWSELKLFATTLVANKTAKEYESWIEKEGEVQEDPDLIEENGPAFGDDFHAPIYSHDRLPWE